MKDKIGPISQGMQFILILGMVFRSLMAGQLDRVFFLMLAGTFILAGFSSFLNYLEEWDQMSLFLALSQVIAGFLFFFIQ